MTGSVAPAKAVLTQKVFFPGERRDVFPLSQIPVVFHMSKLIPDFLITRTATPGPFVVVDDGQLSGKFSVWCGLRLGGYAFITSGADKANALAVAEALNKTNQTAVGMVLQ